MTEDNDYHRNWKLFAEGTVRHLHEVGFCEHRTIFRPLEDLEEGLAVGVNVDTDTDERPLLLEEATAMRDAAIALPHVVAEVQRLRSFIDDMRPTP